MRHSTECAGSADVFCRKKKGIFLFAVLLQKVKDRKQTRKGYGPDCLRRCANKKQI